MPLGTSLVEFTTEWAKTTPCLRSEFLPAAYFCDPQHPVEYVHPKSR